MFSTDAGAEAEDDEMTADVRADDMAGDTESGVVEPDLDVVEPGEADPDLAAAEQGDGGLDVAEPGVADDASPEQEPFFGMQSEGIVVTGLALGPGLRRAAKVCFAATLGLGVLFWLVPAMVFGYRVLFESGNANPDMPHLGDGRALTAYYLVGALWAVGVGAFGLASRGSTARLLWCFACLVSAFYWPIGIAASAGVLVWRGQAAVSRRVALAAVALVVLIGGLGWRFGVSSDTAKAVAVSSDDDLLGTWHSRSGMSVDLRPDSTYDASALTGGGLDTSAGEVPASSGRWDSESTDGHSGVRLLVDGDLANSVWLDVYKAGPDLLLCSTDDPGRPCEVVLRRS